MLERIKDEIKEDYKILFSKKINKQIKISPDHIAFQYISRLAIKEILLKKGIDPFQKVITSLNSEIVLLDGLETLLISENIDVCKELNIQ